MFQFPGLAFVPYVFRNKYLLLISASAKSSCDDRSPRNNLTITDIEGGFPHSEILGSKLVRSSPRHIAAYHVLHRLLAPRHPPDTLKTLDCSHYQRPSLGSDHLSHGECMASAAVQGNMKALIDIIKTSFASNTSGSFAVKRSPRLRCSRDHEAGSPTIPRPNVFPLYDVR